MLLFLLFFYLNAKSINANDSNLQESQLDYFDKIFFDIETDKRIFGVNKNDIDENADSNDPRKKSKATVVKKADKGSINSYETILPKPIPQTLMQAEGVKFNVLAVIRSAQVYAKDLNKVSILKKINTNNTVTDNSNNSQNTINNINNIRKNYQSNAYEDQEQDRRKSVKDLIEHFNIKADKIDNLDKYSFFAKCRVISEDSYEDVIQDQIEDIQSNNHIIALDPIETIAQAQINDLIEEIFYKDPQEDLGIEINPLTDTCSFLKPNNLVNAYFTKDFNTIVSVVSIANNGVADKGLIIYKSIASAQSNLLEKLRHAVH